MNPFDFEKDVIEIIEREASRIGFKLAKGKKFHDTLLDYLTVYNKLIKAKQRQVLICPDLLFKLSNQPLHPKKKEIDSIISIAQHAGDLNKFLSKRAIISNFHDYMRSEWHIYHFHLSLEQDKKSPSFVKQVNQLLFTYIDDNYAIFLGVENHSKGIFADKKWLELIHDNFPRVIEKYKTDHKDMYLGHQSIDTLTSVSRNTLREKGYNLGFIKIKNVVYFNPGLGIMTSGHAMQDVRQVNSIHRWIFHITRSLTERYDNICELLNVGRDDAVFEVIIPENMNGKMCLCEITTRKLVLECLQYFNDKIYD